MSYIVKRSGKKVPNGLKFEYATYNSARQAIRKWINSQKHLIGRIDMFDRINRTVSIGKHGFSIVAA